MQLVNRILEIDATDYATCAARATFPEYCEENRYRPTLFARRNSLPLADSRP